MCFTEAEQRIRTPRNIIRSSSRTKLEPRIFLIVFDPVLSQIQNRCKLAADLLSISFHTSVSLAEEITTSPKFYQTKGDLEDLMFSVSKTEPEFTG